MVSADGATIQQLTAAMESLALLPEVCVDAASALRQLQQRKFEAIIVDWLLGNTAKSIMEHVQGAASNKSAVTFMICESPEESALAFALGSRFTLMRPLSYDSIQRTLKIAYGLIVRERRRYFRCLVEIPAVLKLISQADIHCETVNVSEGGMAIVPPHPLRLGTEAKVQFKLPGKPLHFETDAKVCWSDEKGMAGLQFTALAAEQKSELEEWLTLRFEETLPDFVAERFRKTKNP